MRKLFFIVSLALPLLYSCKEDDPENPSECIVTGIKLKETHQDQSTTAVLKFDTQRRVTEASYKYLSDEWKVVYDYQSDKIIRTETSTGSSYTGTYTLTNGRVIKYTGNNTIIDFTYNSEGYLIKSVNKQGSTTVIEDFNYMDGNLKSVVYKLDNNTPKTYTYLYTPDLAVDLLGYGNPLMLSDNTLEEAGDYFIVGAGYFGKASKNLPSSYQLTNVYNVTYYRDAAGKITSMLSNTPGVNTNTSFTYTCQ